MQNTHVSRQLSHGSGAAFIYPFHRFDQSAMVTTAEVMADLIAMKDQIAGLLLQQQQQSAASASASATAAAELHKMQVEMAA